MFVSNDPVFDAELHWESNKSKYSCKWCDENIYCKGFSINGDLVCEKCIGECTVYIDEEE